MRTLLDDAAGFALSAPAISPRLCSPLLSCPFLNSDGRWHGSQGFRSTRPGRHRSGGRFAGNGGIDIARRRRCQHPRRRRPRTAGADASREAQRALAGVAIPGAHRRHRQARPAPEFGHRTQSGRAEDRRRDGPRARGEQAARPAARHPGPAEGQHRHRRQDEHQRRFAGAGRRARDARCARGRAVARSRRGHHRQDQPERVGQHALDPFGQRLERARRPDAKSVRARSQYQRLELRLRRGDRRQPGHAGGRHRDRRLDRLAGVDLRPGRHQADPRPGQPQRHHPDRAFAGHRRADDAHRRRRGADAGRDGGRRSGRPDHQGGRRQIDRLRRRRWSRMA